MDNNSGGNIDTKRVAELMERFKKAPSATAADRTVKDQLLDELQDAVGLGGKMVTERDIVGRGERLLQGR